MHPEDIKAELRKKGFTGASIARNLGLTRSTVSSVVRRKGRSAKVEVEISRILGKPVEEIFPEIPLDRLFLKSN
ncbi:helix-turn-helix domain-containing protein [Synechococcus sp. PCC 6312]|uniref:helix-turn-helix domain-containing protein n=1 Tax=Synechococcus sp. (strain ATCC 27167 / PCC 6312) TaxID=195253 RepID=UPI00029F0323|nr:putative transcriptional regulator [Synechococcus sp. PCC 6312]